MKVVNLIGGLGNQMFQYAFAIALQHHYSNEDILVDTQHLASLYEYGFELKTVFPNIDFKIASKRQIKAVSRYAPNYKLSRIIRRLLPPRKSEYIERVQDVYDPKVFEQNKDIYFEGYWHAYDYFIDVIPEIRNAFSHPTPNDYNNEMINKIESVNSVGIHVRRGDYLKPEYQHLGKACTLDYYIDAIKKINEEKGDYHYFIFSNDIDWCKQEILPLLETDKVTFVTGNTGINSSWDMFLMSHCKKLIIANSTFSWWGAFLNKNNPTVTVPKFWKVGAPSDGLCAPDWILL